MLMRSVRLLFHETARAPSSRSVLIVRQSCSRAYTSATPRTSDLIPHIPSTPSSSIPHGQPVAQNGVILRPYQLQAISSCLDALSSGLTRIGVSSPTGSGKTTMFMNLIPQIPFHPKSRRRKADSIGGGARGERGQTLIVVSSVELARQAEMAARRLLGEGWSVEVEQSKRMASGRADVTVATYQTLLNTDRLRKFDPANFKLVIVDEAHHAAAHSYLRILQYFHEDVELPPEVEPITNATFSRPDQLALSMAFEEIVFHREVSAMLEEGWLAPAKSTTISADLNLSSVPLTASGDFSAPTLSQHLNTPIINDLIVRTYLHRCSTRRSTLIFAVDLSHVQALTNAFRSAGIDARSVSSLSPPSLRRDSIAGFGEGEFPVLVNCEVLTEGTDIPEIDCIMIARPTRSRNLLAQMVGRGLRLSEKTGKEDCHIVDIVDSVGRAGGLLVAPTLFGLSHEEVKQKQEGMEANADGPMPLGELCGPSVDVVPSWEQGGEVAGAISRGDENVKDEADEVNREVAKEAGDRDLPTVESVTFIDEADPFGLSSRSSRQTPLKMLSDNAWVSCGGYKYVLECLRDGDLKIERNTSDEGKWLITFTLAAPPMWAKGKNRFAKDVKKVALADDLERAVQTADKWAERKFGREVCAQLSRYAPWRRRSPSEKSIEMLFKLKVAQPGVYLAGQGSGPREIVINGRQMPITDLTGGEVSALLCARKHGAKGQQDKVTASEASKVRQAARREQARADKAAALAARNLPFPQSY